MMPVIDSCAIAKDHAFKCRDSRTAGFGIALPMSSNVIEAPLGSVMIGPSLRSVCGGGRETGKAGGIAKRSSHTRPVFTGALAVVFSRSRKNKMAIRLLLGAMAGDQRRFAFGLRQHIIAVVGAPCNSPAAQTRKYRTRISPIPRARLPLFSNSTDCDLRGNMDILLPVLARSGP